MVESEVKIYVSSLSGNKEVKKRQQRVLMILDSKGIPYTAIDITEPNQEKEKDFMQANSTEKGITVSDQNPRHPLPPQIFNGQSYCGDYNGFELANENDQLESFLNIEVKNGTGGNLLVSQPLAETNGKLEDEKPAAIQDAEPIAEDLDVKENLVNLSPENNDINAISEVEANITTETEIPTDVSSEQPIEE